jgi:putative nucleotidyltransferase with HDIG domain
VTLTNRILVCAEDARALEQTRRRLEGYCPGYETIFHHDSRRALYEFQEKPFDLVFLENNFNPDAGVDLLDQMAEIAPRSARFLVSRWINHAITARCVLASHQILNEPLDGRTVEGFCQRSELINRLIVNDTMEQLVSRMQIVPGHPSLYLKISQALSRPDTNLESIAELVSSDCAISTRLVQTVNLPYYGFAHSVSHPIDAMLIIGMETTRGLVLGLEAFSKLQGGRIASATVDTVWEHSQRVAQNGRRIAQLFSENASVAHDAYASGLMHDIGKLVLEANFPKDYQSAQTIALMRQLPLSQVEQETFGVNHAAVGAYLLSMWGLPLSVVEAVARHHAAASEFKSGFNASVALHLSNFLETGEVHDASDIADYPEELGIDERFEEIAQSRLAI